MRLKRLVVAADDLMLAHEAVDDFEHPAHARLRYRAFDNHDQLGLVGRSPQQAPGAVVSDRPHAVDGDEIDDRVTVDRVARFVAAPGSAP